MSKGPVVRVAVISENGMSSNSWRIWIDGSDVYIRCRDNFIQFKASLQWDDSERGPELDSYFGTKMSK